LARKILLADDSVTAQNMGRRILSEAGYEVVTVNNGPAALKKIAEYKPHLVILDVYMPGYGGTEVCQRIKESAETAHIPVLLTVGKLEPFKADEARRVRADGHLVKPFEASELLTVLTKLEDKIVPEPAPQSQSRFAGGLATGRSSPTSAKGKGFGDADSGWKERLAIPSPAAKPILTEPEVPEPTGVTAFRNIAHEEESKPAESVPAQAGVAQDITAEEIAAITAAAATFAEKAEPVPPAPTTAMEEPAASAVSAPEAATAEAPEPAAPEVGSQADAQAAAPEVPPVSEITAQTESNTESEAEAAPVAPPAEAEVAAALESLVPSNGNGAAIEKREEVPVAVGMAAFVGGAQGPRWIAEEIALAADETSLILEREMRKVYAVMAEANASPASFSEAQPETPSFPESDVPPQAESYQTEAAEARFEESSSEDTAAAYADTPTDQQEPEPAVAEAAPVEEHASESSPAPEMTAAPESAQEASVVADPAPALADAVATASTPRTEESGVTPDRGSAEQTDESTAQPPPETAYAAAASAGSAFQSISAAEGSQSPAESGESSASSVPEEVTQEREAELAAAWANWRQVRESLASPQFVSQVADTAAAEFKETHTHENPGAPSDPDSAASTPENPGAISNIVDSVLAELKPKLVEEIAKKLGKEKQ
jgi:CheY-like chemotaxis protein